VLFNCLKRKVLFFLSLLNKILTS